MKKLFALLCSLALIFVVPISASAATIDTGLIFTDWDVQATLSENNVMRQTETIKVHFNEPRHGIYRTIPDTVYIEQQTADGAVTLPYKVKLTDISVPGFEYDVLHENEAIVIRIGDEDEELTGDVVYTISFTLDMGDDRTATGDSIFYSLLGADIAAPIEHCTFNLSLETPLPDGTTFELFSGQYGSVTKSDTISFAQDPNGIRGETTAALSAYSGITITAQPLPEGFFTNERGYSTTPIFIFAGIIIAACIACFLYSATRKRKKPVQTVEFYPPSGITSAEVGFIVDGMADDKDILSLIIYFTDKGYCTLSGEENNMTLTKVKDLSAEEPAYMQSFFNALFAGGATCDFCKGDAQLYEGLQGAKQMLSTEFVGARKLYSTFGSFLSFLVPILLFVIFVIYTGFAAFSLSPFAIVLSAVSAIIGVSISILIAVFSTRWTFSSKSTKTGVIIAVIILSLLGTGIAFEADNLIARLVLMPHFSVIVVYLATLLGSLSIAWANTPTMYFTQISGKLLGLKNFIEKAELERIKLLVNENPQYFYSVLPYAYVFGLSDKWISQFESIAIEPPSWYYGSNANMFNMYWITRSLTYGHEHMVHDFSTKQMQSGGQGGSSFGGGGGGFSGGGFGGGGAGSW